MQIPLRCQVFCVFAPQFLAHTLLPAKGYFLGLGAAGEGGNAKGRNCVPKLVKGDRAVVIGIERVVCPVQEHLSLKVLVRATKWRARLHIESGNTGKI